jgi:4-aminobutyrate aminotransferase-like enzyme
VGDIRGRGFLWGVELVADRASKSPFDPAQKEHARLKNLFKIFLGSHKCLAGMGC